MTGAQRLLVVFGGVQGMTALLLGGAHLAQVKSGGTLPELLRVARWTAAFLGPLGAALAGRANWNLCAGFWHFMGVVWLYVLVILFIL